MKRPSAGRLLHGFAAAALAYCCSLWLAFALLFGPIWLNTAAGVLLEALVWPLRLLGVRPVDGFGLLIVLAFAGWGVLVFGLTVLASGPVKPNKG